MPLQRTAPNAPIPGEKEDNLFTPNPTDVESENITNRLKRKRGDSP